MDRLWAKGWRHFGPLFYRYAQAQHGGALMDVRPLRIDLGRFRLSKSQRRVWRRNQDLSISIQPTRLDDTRRALFHRHKQRFTENVPDAIEDFLGADASPGPCDNVEVSVFSGSKLVAASYLDLGRAAVSSIYAFFDPEASARSLGIFTMLVEIDFAMNRGCRHYYPGYAYRQPSHYDYKKQFHGLESFDWQRWSAMERWTGTRQDVDFPVPPPPSACPPPRPRRSR
jgi:arginine-tRNA-protein transferase